MAAPWASTDTKIVIFADCLQKLVVDVVAFVSVEQQGRYANEAGSSKQIAQVCVFGVNEAIL
eukprot:CAMPEP_0118669566 /NCGR_PEP_ID=MMETSP0785-20121206/20973_1 /TAXON_ID=91992 /ORGANISM="Bolidomonas pacifica, Strain CCMP 1866" /LENGTH=61 /DNA_ID=CAMNT_0006564265 /DNA_START=385 /DNA_END=570 /DNA_ORIENTATION=-